MKQGYTLRRPTLLMIACVVAIGALLCMQAHAAAAPLRTDVNGKYRIDVWGGGGWQPLDTFAFTKNQEDVRLELPAAYRGDVTVRIVKASGGLGFIDSVHVDGTAPVTTDAYAARKLSRNDRDVLEVKDGGLELQFADVSNGVLTLRGLIEAKDLQGAPFFLDMRVAEDDVPQAVFASYRASCTAASDVGSLSVLSAFRAYPTNPVSGHPAGPAYVWTSNDDSYLYVTGEWTSDNTFDHGKDFFTVYAQDAGGGSIKAFTQWSDRGAYGTASYRYTERVPYQHMCYELKIPLAELGAPLEDLNLGFSLYGTAIQAQFDPQPQDSSTGHTMPAFGVVYHSSAPIGTVISATINVVDSSTGTPLDAQYLQGTLTQTETATEGNQIVQFLYSDIVILAPGEYKIHADIFTDDHLQGGVSSNGFTITTLPTFSLTYNVDGKISNAGSFEPGEEVTLAPAPAKPGFEFVGWECSVDGAIYCAGATYQMREMNATMTAVWRELPASETQPKPATPAKKDPESSTDSPPTGDPGVVGLLLLELLGW